MQREPIPRLPVFGWQAFEGHRQAGTPCLIDLPGLHYTTSGRAAILLALEVLGVGPGDQVLLPSYHCPTMVAPTVSLGALPRFYPIDANGTPHLAWLAAQDTTRVRVLLAAHYFGLPQPMGAMRQWCDARGIALVEDCAHALFGMAGERPVGAWGDIAIGSLTKFLPVPEGGCLVVNNGGAALRKLGPCSATAQLKAVIDILEVGAAQGSLHGINSIVSGSLACVRRLRKGGAASSGPGVASPPAADEPSSTDFTIDAELAHRELARPCLWVAQRLPRERVVALRRANYARLHALLAGHSGLRPLMPVLPRDCAPYVFPLWVDNPDPGYAELRRLGMPVFRWDRLWPGTPDTPGDHGLQWSHHVLQLACHQDLSDADLDRFVTALVSLYAAPQPDAARAAACAPATTRIATSALN